jgi:hypothetical protein
MRLAIWFALVGLLWFDVTHDQLAAAMGDDLSSAALTGAALLGLAGRFGAQVVEAGFYVLAWRLGARRLRMIPMLTAIATLSLCDAFAAGLLNVVGTDPPRAWLALLVGFRAFPEWLPEEPGLRMAFGSVGLLAVARMLGTAHAQQQQGIRFGGALALTLFAVLAGRLATWWSADLVRGMSPLP